MEPQALKDVVAELKKANKSLNQLSLNLKEELALTLYGVFGKSDKANTGARAITATYSGRGSTDEDDNESNFNQQDSKKKTSFVGDAREFFEGLKEGGKDIVSYLFGGIEKPEEKKKEQKEEKKYQLDTKIFENILGELVLLRKITEGRIKFEGKSTSKTEYRDATTGKFVKQDSVRQVDKPLLPGTSDVEKEETQAYRIQKELDREANAEAMAEAMPSSGGGLPGIDLPDGRRTGKPTPKGKTGTRILGAVAKGAKFLGVAGAVGAAGYYGYEGWQNARENLGIEEDREATTGEKAASAAGGVVSGLTFGLVDEKSASKFIAKSFGAGPGKSVTPSISTAEAEGMGGGGGPVDDLSWLDKPKPSTSIQPTIAPVRELKLPSGVEKDTATGQYKYKNITFPADTQEALESQVKAIDAGTSALNNVNQVADNALKTMGSALGVSMPTFTPSSSSTLGGEMQAQSAENKTLERASAIAAPVQPVISNNVQNNNTQSFVPLKPTPRVSSPFERIQDRVSVV